MTSTTEAAPAAASARASGSSFYLAMRILPKPQRQAMFEIYSFCREVDDIADEGTDRDQQLRDLDRWRQDVGSLYAGNPPPALSALAEGVTSFHLRQEDFLAVIDGMSMDVVTTVVAPELAVLDLYCDRVASAVGRLSVRVFGMAEEPGKALAHHLGRALQLTNILRDLDEDAAIGRLYLPREALVSAGIHETAPQEVIASPTIDRACGVVADIARRHFREAQAIMAASPRAVVRAPRIMAAAYQLLLERLAERGWRTPRAPMRLRRRQFLWLLLRNVL